MGAEQSVPAEGNDTSIEDQLLPSALVVCGPSGVGKGTLIKRLMAGSDSYGFSVSHTTRAPRPNEQNGEHYHFTTHEAFEAEIAEGKFLEYANVHGNLYGTSIRAVADVAEQGKVCVLDIDVQGTRQVRQSGLRAIFVFVAPPSMEELEERLRGRGTESEEQVAQRLANAATELEALEEPGLFDLVIINADVDDASAQLAAIGARCLAGESGPGDYTLPRGETGDTEGETGDVTPVGPTETEGETDAAAASQSGGEEAAGEAAVPTAAGATETSEPVTESEAEREAASTTPSLTPRGGSLDGDGDGGKPPFLRTYQQHAGKVAIVTGASDELGTALCKALALAGLKVVALAKTREGLQRLQKELVLDAGVSAGSFLPIVCDTTKEAEVVAVPRIVSKRWPEHGVDILINAEDASPARVSLLEGSAELWRDALLGTVLSSCLCAREVVQDMVSRKQYGYIINLVNTEVVAGDEDRVPSFFETLLATSKQAVKSMTEGLYRELTAAQLPLPVCSVEYGGGSVSTTAHIGERTVQFSKASHDLVSDVLEAVAWCLIN